MWIKLAPNNTKKGDTKYIQILLVLTEGATENMGEGFHY